jgi:hypothetical protein
LSATTNLPFFIIEAASVSRINWSVFSLDRPRDKHDD